MKTLELNEMERFVGGQERTPQNETAECYAAQAALLAAIAAAVVSLGWGSIAVAAALVNVHASCAEEV